MCMDREKKFFLSLFLSSFHVLSYFFAPRLIISFLFSLLFLFFNKHSSYDVPFVVCPCKNLLGSQTLLCFFWFPLPLTSVTFTLLLTYIFHLSLSLKVVSFPGDFSCAVAGLIFLEYKTSAQWSAELLVITYGGALKSYLVRWETLTTYTSPLQFFFLLNCFLCQLGCFHTRVNQCLHLFLLMLTCGTSNTFRSQEQEQQQQNFFISPNSHNCIQKVESFLKQLSFPFSLQFRCLKWC